MSGAPAVTYAIGGMDRIGLALSRVGPLFVRAAEQLVTETMLFGEVVIADKIREYEAVDTGRLKGSIEGASQGGGERDAQGRFKPHTYAFDPADSAHKIRKGNAWSGGSRGVGYAHAEIVGIIGTNVRYAIPVHEGYRTRSGRQIPGRPYMADSIPTIEEHLQRRAHDVFGGIL